LPPAIDFAIPAVLKPVLDGRVRLLIGGQRTVDSPLMYLKAAILVASAAGSYLMLVFWASSALAAVGWGLALSLALVGIGFNVQHDGNHGTFSRHTWVNRLAGHSLDVIGASSYFWKDKHNHGHHVYTNIPCEDADIELGPLARLSADHRWRWWHRYQHVYLWFLYTFVHLRYLYSDIQRLAFGKRDRATMRYPRGGELAGLIVGKTMFLVLAFVVPATRHPFGRVFGVYVLVSMVMGLIFSVVFQLAHTVDVVEHPTIAECERRPEWVVHQIETTANFSADSRVITFLLGGLNFQREHHLFPRVAHVHYPAFARIVLDVCRERGITWRENVSFGAALRSHYRFVRRMGMKPA
jgi:linoleoyl-CoA desaturase